MPALALVVNIPLAKHPPKMQQYHKPKYHSNSMYITFKQQITRLDEWRFIQGETYKCASFHNT
jgi:hypothetical protein